MLSASTMYCINLFSCSCWIFLGVHSADASSVRQVQADGLHGMPGEACGRHPLHFAIGFQLQGKLPGLPVQPGRVPHPQSARSAAANERPGHQERGHSVISIFSRLKSQIFGCKVKIGSNLEYSGQSFQFKRQKLSRFSVFRSNFSVFTSENVQILSFRSKFSV